MIVSIPFKREGLSEPEAVDYMLLQGLSVSIPFKREGLSELPPFILKHPSADGVSIPFKREGLSEPNVLFANTINEVMFQFPSNGKVFPNKENQIND